MKMKPIGMSNAEFHALRKCEHKQFESAQEAEELDIDEFIRKNAWPKYSIPYLNNLIRKFATVIHATDSFGIKRGSMLAKEIYAYKKIYGGSLMLYKSEVIHNEHHLTENGTKYTQVLNFDENK